MTMIIDKGGLSRRNVLAGLGGMSFYFAIGVGGARLTSDAQAKTAADAKPFGAWVRIAPDGAITIYSAGAEMGQGSMTSLPLIVAEEMDADWSKVSIEWAPIDPQTFGYTDVFVPAGRDTLGIPIGSRTIVLNKRSMMIVGSRAVMMYYNDLRMAGAQVRKVLLMNAAEKWGADAATLRTEPSAVINPANGQRLTYGEIAAFGTIPSPLPTVAAGELKSKSQFRLIGKDVPRRDTPLKVNGSAQYGIDVKLPGMVYATTLHSPVHKSEPDSWNDAEIKRMPGVIGTVRLPHGIAIVAQHFEQAVAARNALKATWKPKPGAGVQFGERARGLRQDPRRSEGPGAGSGTER